MSSLRQWTGRASPHRTQPIPSAPAKQSPALLITAQRPIPHRRHMNNLKLKSPPHCINPHSTLHRTTAHSAHRSPHRNHPDRVWVLFPEYRPQSCDGRGLLQRHHRAIHREVRPHHFLYRCFHRAQLGRRQSAGETEVKPTSYGCELYE